jgi:N-acetylmuramoyl-L-alanine amidase
VRSLLLCPRGGRGLLTQVGSSAVAVVVAAILVPGAVCCGQSEADVRGAPPGATRASSIASAGIPATPEAARGMQAGGMHSGQRGPLVSPQRAYEATRESDVVASRGGGIGGALPPRVDVVAVADELARHASSLGGEAAVLSLTDAARWRERIWRLEGRTADGLEAVELRKEAERRGSCKAQVEAALLLAEVESEASRAVPLLEQFLSGAASGACRAQAERALGILAAFRLRPKSVETKSRGLSEEVTAGVVAPPSPTHTPGTTSVITRVERYGAKDNARIVVSMTQPTTFRVGLIDPEDGATDARLYIDIDRAEIQGTTTFSVGGLVERVRFGSRSDGLRMVLDLNGSVERRVFYVPEPFRLVVDVGRSDHEIPSAPLQRPELRRVVLDPGHGGHDPGAIGPRGLREKDVTLDIAHRAAPLIARELGVVTLLTRDVDAYVGLDERTARANAFGADLFVSIHCNAAEKTGSDGVMTFVLDDSSDAAASRVAALENEASAAAARELASVFVRVQDERTLKNSVHFAELLQRSTIASVGTMFGKVPDQGVRRAGFYVLAGAHMPAVLYEVAFISNPDGEVRLNLAEYRQKLADAIVNATRAYRDGI